MITIHLPNHISEVPKSFSKKVTGTQFTLDYTNIEGQWYVSQGNKLITDCVTDKEVLKDYAKSVINKYFP